MNNPLTPMLYFMKMNHRIIIGLCSLVAISCKNKEDQEVNLMNGDHELIMAKEDIAERVIQASYKGKVSIDTQLLKDRVHFLNQCLVKMGFSHEQVKVVCDDNMGESWSCDGFVLKDAEFGLFLKLSCGNNLLAWKVVDGSIVIYDLRGDVR